MVLLETASRDRHRLPSPRCTAHLWPASPDRLTRALVLGAALWCAVLTGAQAAEEGTSPRRTAYSGRVQTELVPHAVPEAARAAPRVMRVSTATQVDPPSDPDEPLFRETAAADTPAAGPATTASTHTGKTGRPTQMAPVAAADKALANPLVGGSADGASARRKAAVRTSAPSDRAARHGQADQAGKAEKRTAAVGRSRPQGRAERVALPGRRVHKPEAGHIAPRAGQPLAGRSHAVRRPQAPTRQGKSHAAMSSRHVASTAQTARSATKPTARPHRQLAQAAGAKAPARDARARHQTAQAGKGARKAAHGATHTVANTVAHDATRKADAAPAVSPARKLRQAKAGGPRPAAAQPSAKPARQATRQPAVRPAGSRHASARHGRPVPADARRPAKPRG